MSSNFTVLANYTHTYDLASRVESEKLNGGATMAEHHARLVGERARFHERIFHSGHLLHHGAQGIADHGGANALGAQVT